jgi:hypothetical protein
MMSEMICRKCGHIYNILSYCPTCLYEVETALASAEAERDKWRNALVGVTVGGTEFFHDAEYCARWVKKLIKRNLERSKNIIIRCRTAEAERDAAVADLRKLRQSYLSEVEIAQSAEFKNAEYRALLRRIDKILAVFQDMGQELGIPFEWDCDGERIAVADEVNEIRAALDGDDTDDRAK